MKFGVRKNHGGIEESAEVGCTFRGVGGTWTHARPVRVLFFAALDSFSNAPLLSCVPAIIQWIETIQQGLVTAFEGG